MAEVASFRHPGTQAVDDFQGPPFTQHSPPSLPITTGISKNDMLDDLMEVINQDVRSPASHDAPATVYYKECDRPGCSYVTIKSKDPLAYQGMVLDLQAHIQDKHSGKNHDGSNEAARAYAEATKTVQVPAG